MTWFNKVFNKKSKASKTKGEEFLEFIEANANIFDYTKKGSDNIKNFSNKVLEYNFAEILPTLYEIDFMRRHSSIVNLVNTSRAYLNYQRDMIQRMMIFVKYNFKKLDKETLDSIQNFTETVNDDINFCTGTFEMLLNLLAKDILENGKGN